MLSCLITKNARAQSKLILKLEIHAVAIKKTAGIDFLFKIEHFLRNSGRVQPEAAFTSSKITRACQFVAFFFSQSHEPTNSPDFVLWLSADAAAARQCSSPAVWQRFSSNQARELCWTCSGDCLSVRRGDRAYSARLSAAWTCWASTRGRRRWTCGEVFVALLEWAGRWNSDDSLQLVIWLCHVMCLNCEWD